MIEVGVVYCEDSLQIEKGPNQKFMHVKQVIPDSLPDEDEIQPKFDSNADSDVSTNIDWDSVEENLGHDDDGKLTATRSTMTSDHHWHCENGTF